MKYFLFSEHRLIFREGTEKPQSQGEEMNDVEGAIDDMRQNEVAELRLKRVQRWLNIVSTTGRLLDVEQVESNGDHETFKFTKKGGELLLEVTSKDATFDQAEFVEAALHALGEVPGFTRKEGAKENISLEEQFRQLKALQDMREWLKEALPERSSNYDIGYPKGNHFATVSYGLYTADGNHVHDLIEQNPEYMVPKDRFNNDVLIYNRSGFRKDHFKHLVKESVGVYEKRK